MSTTAASAAMTSSSLKAKPFAVIVQAEVKMERMDEFLTMIAFNAAETRKEPGCLRFGTTERVCRDLWYLHQFIMYRRCVICVVSRSRISFYFFHPFCPTYYWTTTDTDTDTPLLLDCQPYHAQTNCHACACVQTSFAINPRKTNSFSTSSTAVQKRSTITRRSLTMPCGPISRKPGA